MSDEEFDALEEELRRSDSSHPYFSTIGFMDVREAGDAKIPHKVPMLSMAKVKTPGGVEKWLKRINSNASPAISIQPKIDGLSASCSYNQGTLLSISTRGDGELGQDISHIAEFVSDIPQHIKFTADPVEVRGELYLPKDTSYDTGGRPLRNNCVGLINRKDARDELKYVHFIAYQIIWPDSTSSGATAAPVPQSDTRFHSEFGKLQILREEGFTSFDARLLQSHCPDEDGISQLVEQTEAFFQKYIGTLRDEWNYETDGLILVIDDNRLHDAIDTRWVVDHHHHYALALKPPSPSANTPLKSIIWQVSRQGNLTPVAQFEPLRMGGAVLERASLHNADNVRRLKLSVGDSIVVERANDVIPYVRENPHADERSEDFIDSRLWPSECPSCGSAIVEAGVNMACPNPSCRSRVLQSILYWVRSADIEHVALKTLEALYDVGRLRRIRDLYTLTAGDFDNLEGFAEKKISNFLEQVAGSKTMSAIEFISRLGIPMVQKKSLDRLGIVSIDDFYRFEDESYVIGQRIVEWKNEAGNMEFIHELLSVITLSSKDTPSSDRGNICLTGKAPMPRKTLIRLLEEKGWTISSAVSSQTHKLICDDPAAQSTKLIKARKNGIPVLTYREFLANEGVLDDRSYNY